MLFFFKIASTDSGEYLELQKVNGSKIGHITWSLNKLKSLQVFNFTENSAQSNNPMPKLNSSLTHLNQSSEIAFKSTKSNSNTLNEQQMFLHRIKHDDLFEFRYYSGAKANTCYASSVALRIILSNSISNGSSSSSSSSSFESFSSPSVLSSLALSSTTGMSDNEFVTFKISGMSILLNFVQNNYS